MSETVSRTSVAGRFRANHTVTEVDVTLRSIGPARTSGSVARLKGETHVMARYSDGLARDAVWDSRKGACRTGRDGPAAATKSRSRAVGKSAGIHSPYPEFPMIMAL